MPVPTLIIGLGTTGLQIAGAVKKNIIERNNGVEPDYIKYVIFETVSDNNKNLYGISGSEYVSIGAFKVSDAINLWKKVIDNSFQMVWPNDKYLPSLTTFKDGAGMIRCHGKLAFWYNTILIKNNLTNYIRSLSKLSDEIDDNGLKVIDVWITGILSNGTCGGTFLDVSYLIRQILEEEGDKAAHLYYMFVDSSVVYQFIGKRDIKTKAAANGIAAINELHYWMYENNQRTYKSNYPVFGRDLPMHNREGKIPERPAEYIFLIQSQNRDGSLMNNFDDYSIMAANGITSFTLSDKARQRIIDASSDATGRDNYASINYLKIEFPVNVVKEYCIGKYSLELMSRYFLNNSFTNIEAITFSSEKEFSNDIINFVNETLKIEEREKDQLFDQFEETIDYQNKLNEINKKIDNLIDKNNFATILNNLKNDIDSKILPGYDKIFEKDIKNFLSFSKDAYDSMDNYARLTEEEKKIFNASLKHKIEYKLNNDYLNFGYFEIGQAFLQQLQSIIQANRKHVNEVEALDYRVERDWNNQFNTYLQELSKAYESFFNKSEKVNASKSNIKNYFKNRLKFQIKQQLCSKIINLYDDMLNFIDSRINSLDYFNRIFSDVKLDLNQREQEILKAEIPNFSDNIKSQNNYNLDIGLYYKTLDEFIYDRIKEERKFDYLEDSKRLSRSSIIPKLREISKIFYEGPQNKINELSKPNVKIAKKEELKKVIYENNDINELFSKPLNSLFKLEDILGYEMECLLNDYWTAIESKDGQKSELQLKRWTKYFKNADLQDLANTSVKDRDNAKYKAITYYLINLCDKIKPFWKHQETKEVQTVIIYDDENSMLNQQLEEAVTNGRNSLVPEKLDSKGNGKFVIEIMNMDVNIAIDKLDIYKSMYENYEIMLKKNYPPVHTDKRFQGNIWTASILSVEKDADFETLAYFAFAEHFEFITTDQNQKRNYKLGIRCGKFDQGTMIASGREDAISEFKHNVEIRNEITKKVEDKFRGIQYGDSGTGNSKGVRGILDEIKVTLGEIASSLKQIKKTDNMSLIELWENQYNCVQRFGELKKTEYGISDYEFNS